MEPRRSARLAAQKGRGCQPSQAASPLLTDGEMDCMGRRDGRGRPRKSIEEKKMDKEEAKHCRNVHWYSWTRMGEVASKFFGVDCLDDLSNAQYDACLQRANDIIRRIQSVGVSMVLSGIVGLHRRQKGTSKFRCMIQQTMLQRWRVRSHRRGKKFGRAIGIRGHKCGSQLCACMVQSTRRILARCFWIALGNSEIIGRVM